ncbi:MAG: hypothetical protein N3A68_03320 [Bacteroidia bacterium]|nr:hypothetical protein [Bacteroidia bacterium]GIV24063.1 MAG: hypothetical protein KatS3mg025_1722 [Bacteroidia bacterium]
MRQGLLLLGVLWGQVLGIGRSLGPGGQVIGGDTVFPAGELVLRYRLPGQWQRDTFLFVVRNALGIVARGRLFPSKAFAGWAYGRFSLRKAGFYVVTVHHARTGGRVWAARRFYVLSPPYHTVGQVRAYHNALIAKASPPQQLASPNAAEVERALEEVRRPLPTEEALPVELTQEDWALPEVEESLSPSSEADDFLNDDELNLDD